MIMVMITFLLMRCVSIISISLLFFLCHFSSFYICNFIHPLLLLLRHVFLSFPFLLDLFFLVSPLSMFPFRNFFHPFCCCSCCCAMCFHYAVSTATPASPFSLFNHQEQTVSRFLCNPWFWCKNKKVSHFREHSGSKQCKVKSGVLGIGKPFCRIQYFSVFQIQPLVLFINTVHTH